MTASDFIHVYGVNTDADHPYGDLDRIDLTADIMPKRDDSDNRLFGIDPAFLLEAAYERYDAVNNKDGVSRAPFSRKITDSAVRIGDQLRRIHYYLDNMATSVYGAWWKVPIPTRGVRVAQSADLRNIYRDSIFNSEDLSDYSPLTETPHKLRKQPIKNFYKDFGKTEIFSSPADQLKPRLTRNDYKIELERMTDPPELGTNVLFSYYFHEQHLPHDPSIQYPLITEYAKATVKSFAKPEFHNQYWDGVWSRLFGVFHVDSTIICNTPGCVYYNSQPVSKWVSDDGLGNIETYLEKGLLPRVIAVRIPRYLEAAGVALLESGSTPEGAEQTHTHQQTIKITYNIIQPLLRLRGRTLW